MPSLQEFPKALRWLRLTANRKQGEVARAAGLTPAMLCAYENGTRKPSLGSLQKLLAALGADNHDLAVALEAVDRRARPGVPSGEKNESRGKTVRRVLISDLLEPSHRLPQDLEASLQSLLDTFSALLHQIGETLRTPIEKTERRDTR